MQNFRLSFGKAHFSQTLGFVGLSNNLTTKLLDKLLGLSSNLVLLWHKIQLDSFAISIRLYQLGALQTRWG